MNMRDFTATARQLLVAGLALAPDDRVQTYERYLDLLKFFEKLAAPAPDSPPVVRYQFEVVHEARLEAEVELLVARRALDNRKQPAVSPNADAVGTSSSATDARPDVAETLAGPAPDIHDASGPLNPRGKTLAQLVRFDDQQPQPGESGPRKQLMERYNAALHSVKSAVNGFGKGKSSAKLLCHAAREFTDARLALFEDPWQRVPIANWYSQFALAIWRQTEARLHAGDNAHETREDEGSAHGAYFDARSKYREILAALPALLWSKLAEIAPNDDERQKLLKERYNAALGTLRGSYVRHRVDPTVPFTEIIAAARQVLPADVALQAQPAARLRAHEQYLALMKYLEKEAEALRKAQRWLNTNSRRPTKRDWTPRSSCSMPRAADRRTRNPPGT